MVRNDSGAHLETSSMWHLADDEVQVWCASLEYPPQVIAEFFSLLSPDEKARISRFYFERDRNRFTIARGLLRTLIGHYLAVGPAQIEFSYGEYGKPALKEPSTNRVFQFNLAHSNSQAVFIFSWNRLVGIDVEHVHEITNEARFAEQLFSPSESAAIHALAAEESRRVFFEIWTCKEALFKARGHGLSVPLDRTEVSLEAGRSVRLVSLDGSPELATGWHLEIFSPAPGYQGSIAIEGHTAKISIRQSDFMYL